MDKSITIVGNIVDFVYVIKDINIDKITLDKYYVRCRIDVTTAWEGTNDDNGGKVIEVTLEEKISTVTLIARANVIEMAAIMGGKIIKDIIVERAKRGKKVYISGIILFNEEKEMK